MNTFTGSLQLDFGDWGKGNGRIAILLNRIGWRDISLPKGFMSDGASTPRFLWWFLPPWGDRSTVAAILHDYLCDMLAAGTPIVTPFVDASNRADCDRLFREALEELGVSKPKAFLAWLGVRGYSIVNGIK